MNEKIRKLAEKRAQAYTDARAILDAATGDVLSAEDQTRYDALMDEYDSLGTQIRNEQRALNAERELDAPLDEPTRPEPRGGDPNPEAETRVSPRATPEYRAAFTRFLRGGLASLTADQTRALQADLDEPGGFTVAPQQFVTEFIQELDDMVIVRELATTHTVDRAESLGVPTLAADPDDADWTSEIATGSEDSAMKFGKRELRPHPLAKRLKVSRKLLRQSAIDVDGLVRQRLAYKHAVAAEKAYLTGTGAQQPLGIFTASSDGISTGRDTTAAAAAAIAGDDLINVKYDVKEQYLRNARWILNRLVLKAVRKLKDTNGQYIWAPGGIGQASLSVDQPDTILELPFHLSEFAPSTIATGLYTIALGDFSFYWIADALDMQIQRLDELYAETNQVGFIGRLETDGMPVLEDAFRRLIQA